eukprot:4965954-Amphidinium_carterae.1
MSTSHANNPRPRGKEKPSSQPSGYACGHYLCSGQYDHLVVSRTHVMDNMCPQRLGPTYSSLYMTPQFALFNWLQHLLVQTQHDRLAPKLQGMHVSNAEAWIKVTSAFWIRRHE